MSHSNSTNKYKLGLFIIISIIALFICLFLFGAFQIFKKKIECMTVVNSSVQGLAVGAKVKYNGVPIGEVEGIKVAPHGQSIYIFMAIFPESLYYIQDGSMNKVEAFKKFIEDGVKKGLRCQLKYEGITGTLYQEVQFMPKDTVTETMYPKLPDSFPVFIPSVQPVLIGSILGSINKSLSKLSGLDKTFKEVNSVLENINNYLGSDDMKSIISDLKNSSNNINNLTKRLDDTLSKEKLESITNEIHSVLHEAQGTVTRLNKTVKNANIKRILDDAQTAITSTNQLIKNLNNYPSSIVWGKPTQPIVPSE